MYLIELKKFKFRPKCFIYRKIEPVKLYPGKIGPVINVDNIDILTYSLYDVNK